MDLKSILLPYAQLVSLCSALRCSPRLEYLALRLRTHRKSHGKAYRDAVCTPPAYMYRSIPGMQQGCSVCSRCKDDTRLSVLTAAMPFVPELTTLELLDCMFDYGSARHFMWLLAPLVKLQTLKISGGGQWLFHCARWSLFCAVSTLPELTRLDLSGNAWNVLAFVLRPLARSKSLEQVVLRGSLILDTVSSDLKDKVVGAKVLNILPGLAISVDQQVLA
jgi:hypothetical protein